jgi:hypothetical protein
LSSDVSWFTAAAHDVSYNAIRLDSQGCESGGRHRGPHLGANPVAAMHRDFSKFFLTNEDRLTLRKWKNSAGIFYGLALLLLVSFVAIQSRPTGVPHQATASGSNTMAAIEKSRLH